MCALLMSGFLGVNEAGHAASQTHWLFAVGFFALVAWQTPQVGSTMEHVMSRFWRKRVG